MLLSITDIFNEVEYFEDAFFFYPGGLKNAIVSSISVFEYPFNKLKYATEYGIDPVMADIETAMDVYSRDNTLPKNWENIYKVCLVARVFIDAEIRRFFDNYFMNAGFFIKDIKRISGDSYLINIEYLNS